MKALVSPAAVAAVLFLSLPTLAQVHASETPVPAATPAPEPLSARTGQQPTPVPVPANGAAVLTESRVFRYEDMTVRPGSNGAESRTVTHGTLRSGESVHLHESTQPAGIPAVALHTIHHTEFVCIQQGNVTFDHVDQGGKTVSEPAGPGSVIYVAEGASHRIRNTGSEPARYFVLAIGGDAK